MLFHLFFYEKIGFPLSMLLALVQIYLKKSDLIYNVNNRLDELKYNLFYAVLAGVITSVNQIVFNMSLELEDASKISIIKATEIFFIFVMQYTFLNIKTDLLNTIGAILILSSTFIIIIYKILDQRYSTDPKNSKSKKPHNKFKKIFFFKI